MDPSHDRREVRFTIGDIMPSSSPLSRWLTVLAMTSNDFFRMFAWLEEASDNGTRILAFRLIASAFCEASMHLDTSLRRFPEIRDFTDALDDEARAEAKKVCGALDPKSPSYLGAWVEKHRNVTFHYAEMHPEKAAHGQEEITQALQDAAAIESTITHSTGFGTVRFNFADEVAVQWLPDVSHDDAEQLVALREANLALARFTQRAIGSYLRCLPAETIRHIS